MSLQYMIKSFEIAVCNEKNLGFTSQISEHSPYIFFYHFNMHILGEPNIQRINCILTKIFQN